MTNNPQTPNLTITPRQTLPYLTDSHLNDMGFSRDTFVEGIKARVSAELDAAEAANNFAAPVNENLLGAV